MNPSWGQQVVLLVMYSPAQCWWHDSGPVSAHRMDTLACSVYCGIVVAHESNKPEYPYCVTLPTHVSPPLCRSLSSKEMMTFHVWTATIFFVWITPAEYSTKRNYSNFLLFVINTVTIQMLPVIIHLVPSTSDGRQRVWLGHWQSNAETHTLRQGGVGVVGVVAHAHTFLHTP